MNIERITRKSLLNLSKIEYLTHNCNHYKGCWHNCQYPCYARTLCREKEEQWRRVRVVGNALKILEKDIHRLLNWRARTRRVEEIGISTMTDPYQPIEAGLELTRRVLEFLVTNGLHVRIITKSPLVRRDFDVFKGWESFGKIGLTIITLSEKQRKIWEPNAPPIAGRIEAIKEAWHLGLNTWVSMEPIILGVTKPLEIVKELTPWVDEWVFGRHNYTPGSFLHNYVPIREKIIKYCEQRNLKFLIKKELMAIQTPKGVQQTLV